MELDLQTASAVLAPGKGSLDFFELPTGLTEEEAVCLSALSSTAQAYAPELAAAALRRLGGHSPSVRFVHTGHEHLRERLQQWFIEMFQRRAHVQPCSGDMSGGHLHQQLGIPMRYLLAVMDVVLAFGERVAETSPQPTLARSAFHKRLALDFSTSQAYEDLQLSLLADMLLLD